MADYVLEICERDVSKEKNPNAVRRSGYIPAIVYGNHKDNLSIKLSASEFEKKFHGKIESNIFIDLVKEGSKDLMATVFVKEIQRAAMTQNIQHIDFVAIDPNEKITISVPVRLEGQSEGVVKGGLLEFIMRHVDISCLPKDVPQEFLINIEKLQKGESVHASDIELKEGVKLVSAGGATVVSIIDEKGPSSDTEEAEAKE